MEGMCLNTGAFDQVLTAWDACLVEGCDVTTHAPCEFSDGT